MRLCASGAGWTGAKIHTTAHRAAITPKTRPSRARAAWAPVLGKLFAIVHPPPLRREQGRRDRHNHQEEHPGHGAGIAHVEIAPRTLEEVEGIKPRAIAWPTLGHDIGLREILKDAYYAHDQVKEDH